MASMPDFTAPGCYAQSCRLHVYGDDEVYLPTVETLSGCLSVVHGPVTLAGLLAH